MPALEVRKQLLVGVCEFLCARRRAVMHAGLGFVLIFLLRLFRRVLIALDSGCCSGLPTGSLHASLVFGSKDDVRLAGDGLVQ